MNSTHPKKSLTILLLLLCTSLYCQNIYIDLYGFRLGQNRSSVKNQLGKPLVKDKFDDGFEYEMYLLKPDTSLYMVIEYAAGETEIIWSIQISGRDANTDLKINGLKLGDDKSVVEKKMGKPSEKEAIGKYGQRWEYSNSNVSVEINKKGKLSSIKIKDIYAGRTPEFGKIPTFAQVVKALTASSNADIAKILSPDVEIYYKDKSISFTKSFQTEVETDPGKVFATIKTIARGLEKINPKDTNAYEENMRIIEKKNAMHVMKIKKGHLIKEIVLHYVNGQFLVWEIKTEN
jgi:outer membrane protein assembly factor BamE (lipoprotein component of BamABCDE complex)